MSLNGKFQISESLSDLKLKILWILFGSSLQNQQSDTDKNTMISALPPNGSKPEFYFNEDSRNSNI